MAKKITAPKTYDPGKGRPKEHLAYLNQREMDYLRSINGNNMERGPRGLPSFPPDDAIGSSSRSTSSGNKTGVGGGGGGGGGSTGSRGSSTGSVGSRSGSEAPGNLGGGGKGGASPSGPAAGAGGQRGAGSNYGPGSARPGTPSSPMGGQNPSFSSPSAASNYNRDQVAQQRAAIKDAVGVVRSNSALKSDLQVGGIRSLSVGPIGTTVSVPKALTSAVSGAVNPAKTGIAQSLKYSSPIGPAYGPDQIAEMNRLEQEFRDFEKYGNPPTPTGSPAMAGAFPTVGAPSGIPSIGYGNFTTPYSGPAPSIGNYVDRYSADISGSVPEEKYSVGEYNLPEPTIPDRVDVNDGLDPFGQFQNKNVTDIGKVPTGPSYGKLSGYSGYSFDPSSAAQREAIDRGLSESVINAALSSEVPQSTPATASSGPFRRGASEGLPDGYAERYGLGDYAAPTESTDVTAETPAYNKYVDPVTQQPAYPEKGLPMKIAEHLGILGKVLKLANWNEKRRFDNMTPEQQAAAMERWARQRAEYGKNMGQDNDRGPYSRSEPYDPRESTRGRKRPEKPEVPDSSGSRPQQYFNWDVGIGIPSPTDSDYTLYLKYLQEKAAARAALS